MEEAHLKQLLQHGLEAFAAEAEKRADAMFEQAKSFFAAHAHHHAIHDGAELDDSDLELLAAAGDPAQQQADAEENK